jgi:hypothetical protein
VPIDQKIVEALSLHGLPKRLRFDPWSRIKSYGDYMEFQRWVRNEFTGSVPLAVEFHLWEGQMLRRDVEDMK